MQGAHEDELLKLLAADPAAALHEVRRALADSPDDPELWAWQAECLGELGDFDEAVGAWGRVLTLDPDLPHAYVERARLFAELGRLGAAEAELSAAVELFEEDGQTALVRGFLAEIRGDWDAAEAAFERAADLDPEIDPPCRLDSEEVLSALLADGTYSAVTLEPMPDDAGDEGYGRAVDLDEDGGIVVYQRNIERELPFDASVAEFLELVLEVLEPAE